MKKYMDEIFRAVVLGSLLLILAIGSPTLALADSKLATLEKVSTDQESARPNTKALIFVHGTTGDSHQTWTGINETFWPKLVTQDDALNDFDVFVFDYFTPALSDSPSIVSIASQLNSVLRENNILSLPSNRQYQKLYFVAHSLGNLIVRQTMKDKEAYKFIHVPLIIALAAPNQGAELASIANHISQNRTLQGMTVHDGNDFLKGLNLHWLRDHPETEIVCAYEELEFPSPEGLGFWGQFLGLFTPQIGKIVSQASATAVCSPSREVRSFSTDHVWIAKPGEQGLNDPRHAWLRQELTARSNIRRLLTIKLLDSPLVTYDKEFRDQGKLNSHHIQEILREIPLDSDPIPVDQSWDISDTDYLIRQNPDLVVVHFSAFRGEAMQDTDYRGRLTEFLNAIFTKTTSHVLVYSRWREDILGKMNDYFYSRIWTYAKREDIENRLTFLDLRKIPQGGTMIHLEEPTFRDPLVKNLVIKKVKQILELP